MSGCTIYELDCDAWMLRIYHSVCGRDSCPMYKLDAPCLFMWRDLASVEQLRSLVCFFTSTWRRMMALRIMIADFISTGS